MELIFRPAVEGDFEGIIHLQNANFVGNLDPAEKKQGYLSSRFSREELYQMNDDLGIVVAVTDDRVCGFVGTTSYRRPAQTPILEAMSQRFEELLYDGVPLLDHRIFFYGPACVEDEFRGQGVLRGMFEMLKQTMRARFDVGIAFIARENKHSFTAHISGLQMQCLGEFSYRSGMYDIAAFRV
jgi:hypothetical protein